MNQTKMAQKQHALAEIALQYPEHRFTNLYSLLHWDYWITQATETVLQRPGSATAGVDGHTRNEFITDYQAEVSSLIDMLKHHQYDPQPVRRTYIPKGTETRRPLGIPVLRDRIVQEAIRAILDPIYESDFCQHSYGFRKGRCTMDAIAVMMPMFNSSLKYYYVIEADMKSYFDTVHHRTLISILKRRIADREIIDLLWKFLKAGVMEDGLFTKTDTGVPQGGIISPLLANIYLHELDRWAEARWNISPQKQRMNRYHKRGNYKLIRYADDFVIVSNGGIAGVRTVQQELKEYLETMLHLQLSEEKTKITHVNDGFTFLGYHMQRVKSHGTWVVHLRPSRQAKEHIKKKIAALTSRHNILLDEFTELKELNDIIRGWAEYYKHCQAQIIGH